MFSAIYLEIKFGNVKTNVVSLHRICENSSVGRARPCPKIVDTGKPDLGKITAKATVILRK